ILVAGELALYIERGGRTLLILNPEHLDPALGALAHAVRRGALGRLTIERVDGVSILAPESTAIRESLEQSGFVITPKGLRMRK
ncbi:MAG TPA: hypothetical protein PKL71_07025, partial [Marmoricola sp.]|nr:hypothetical protein [Marmoricola sp.]